MKFFFPDSLDQIDPGFNFETEARSPNRIRQRDDLYAHEVFPNPPYDGLVVSKGIVDGVGIGTGKYSMPQRHRLLRVGAREFFRLDRIEHRKLQTMGDCGAFSYVKEEVPPYSVDDVLDFYEACGFDLGVSVDHVILGYDSSLDNILPNLDLIPPDWLNRQNITLNLAEDFIIKHRTGRCQFIPVGVAQGWSPASYAKAVSKLQSFGYHVIALGGLVPLKTFEILDILGAVSRVRAHDTRFHLLGVTRCENMHQFSKLGVASFDSTSPLRQAFMDDKDNYYGQDRTYRAIRVPQVDANPTLRRLIRRGEVDQQDAHNLEKRCLKVLNDFDKGKVGIEETLDLLWEYEALVSRQRPASLDYREVLLEKPWLKCTCDVCRSIGINVIIFRGAERNRRRGFHNLFVFYDKLKKGFSVESLVSS